MMVLGLLLTLLFWLCDPFHMSLLLVAGIILQVVKRQPGEVYRVDDADRVINLTIWWCAMLFAAKAAVSSTLVVLTLTLCVLVLLHGLAMCWDWTREKKNKRLVTFSPVRIVGTALYGGLLLLLAGITVWQ